MGGLACWQRRSAILLYDTVPTSPHELEKFDAQMRQLYAAPGVPEAVADTPTTAGKVMTVCDLLSKTTWTQQDRITLLGIIEDLYE